MRWRKDAGAAARYRPPMDITPKTPVGTIAANAPAAIAIFQKHGIDFCCGGGQPLSKACATRGVDAEAIIAELQEVLRARDTPNEPWMDRTLADLMAHIQRRYHVPLREELPRLSAMLAKVVERHGDRWPAVLLPLQETFERMRTALLAHMAKEDEILFPAVTDLETGSPGARQGPEWLHAPVEMLTAEHEDAGQALARMRTLTGSYTPPPDACPTFRGLYYGLSELERDMQVHVHLENNVLFPRALALARTGR